MKVMFNNLFFLTPCLFAGEGGGGVKTCTWIRSYPKVKMMVFTKFCVLLKKMLKKLFIKYLHVNIFKQTSDKILVKL